MKKKIVALMGCMLALGGLAYLGTQLWAQQPAQAPPRAQTRIAVMNVSYVIKNYQKYVNYVAEMKKASEVYQERDKAKRQEMERIVNELKKPELTAAQKEQLERQAINVRREVEDISKEAQKFLATRSDEQMVQVYKEVRDAAQRYAVSQGFEMVLHFNDELANSPDYDSPKNIARKLQATGMMPVYVHPGMDISYQVVQTLNAAHARSGAGAAAPRGN